MKLSELINKLQRFHDLYPQIDPQITLTEIAYCSYDKNKAEPEFFCRTLNEITCFELQTFLHIPAEELFSERGPYLNIFYEGDVVDKPEDYWKNNYFAQHANKQTGSTNPSSSTKPGTGNTVDQNTVPNQDETDYGTK